MFFLLVFYVISTSFAPETGVPIERPSSTRSQAMNGDYVPVAVTRAGVIQIGERSTDVAGLAALVDDALRAGGRLLLRIEDIDEGRCRREYEAAIHEDLAWLGIEWETPVRRQSDHFADYDAALQKLIARGVVYRCFKTRKEIIDEIARAPHLSAKGPDGPVFVGAAPAARRSRGGFRWRARG